MPNDFEKHIDLNQINGEVGACVSLNDEPEKLGSCSQSKNSVTSSMLHKKTIKEEKRIYEDLLKVQNVLKDNIYK